MNLAKICILGDISVGKTSLIRRFVDRSFSDTYLSTVGVKISRKVLEFPGQNGHPGGQVQLILWDLEGGEHFAAISSTYLKGALAGIVVGDLTRQTTLASLSGYVDLLRSANPAALAIIALNKSDLVDPEQAQADGRIAPDDRAFRVVYASAKTGSGVDELFRSLGTQILQRTGNGSSD